MLDGGGGGGGGGGAGGGGGGGVGGGGGKLSEYSQVGYQKNCLSLSNTFLLFLF